MKKIYKLPAGAHIFPVPYDESHDYFTYIIEGLNTARDWYITTDDNSIHEVAGEWEVLLYIDTRFRSFYAQARDFILVSDNENI